MKFEDKGFTPSQSGAREEKIQEEKPFERDESDK